LWASWVLSIPLPLLFFCGTGVWAQGLHLKALQQPFLWRIFSGWDLSNYLLRLASNHDLLDLCLLSG
jgi:hypothetical protein